GVTPGTPAYMAPEQAAGRRNEVGPQTDVWALGVILYELLTGHRPINGMNREEILHQILTTTPRRPRELVPSIDPLLEAQVLRCLEKDSARRYASAGALADDLARWLRGEVSRLPKLDRPARLPRMLRRNAVRVGIMGACLAGILILAGVALWRQVHPAVAPPPEKIVLIGDGHVLPFLNWIAGGQGAEAKPAGDGLLIHSADTSLLELLPAAPWERYRLEAEVRLDETTEGQVGLYFAQDWLPSGP